MNDYQKFIHQSRYARWNDEKQRRETWEETVRRLVDYYDNAAKLEAWEVVEIEKAITELEVMPSMRAMMTAGPALDRCNVAAYNCAYLPVDSLRSFDEAMYILMCGTGVGFSVEEKYVSQLPRISETFDDTDTTVVVQDSKEGWARGFREVISLLVSGQIPRWDVSKLRPAGARLKTFGGRASGPEPLVKLFNYSCDLFRRAAGRKLTPLECHDLMCMVADVVVVGGVRRSAMISLSDLGSEPMAKAKSGQWYETAVHRQLSNNSAVYEQKPTVGEFLKEWKELYESGSGERGIFNRDASRRIVEGLGKRDPNHEFGTNPCSEIILRPFQFCNLTEVVVRSGDKLDDLKRKVRLATILGTIQSTFTNFKYLRKIWQKNTEEERLLGVSLTGIADNPALLKSEGWLNELKKVANEVNAEWADRLGIPRSAAITCVKPSGTVSQLVDSASGIHPRWSHFYVRTVRNDAKDPLSQFLRDMGVPSEPDQRNPSAIVFSFPQKAPDRAVVRKDLKALEFLEQWKKVQNEWCEHKPSVTISVAEDEWMDVAAWVYREFDIVSGVSFLPFDPTEYPQAPYQTITEEQSSSVSHSRRKIAWGAKVSPTFRERIWWIADTLRLNPDDLMACIAWESGETFSASIKNAAGSGATGLIQFMPSTARGLGTTTANLAKMTPEDQLSYVYKYFRPYAGRLNNLGDIYMAILWPKGVGKPDSYVLWEKGASPTTFRQNAGLDINGDKRITRAEAVQKVQAKLVKGLQERYIG